MPNILTTLSTTSPESVSFTTVFLIFWIIILVFIVTRITSRVNSPQVTNTEPNTLNTTNRMIHALKTRTKEDKMDITGTLTQTEVKEHMVIDKLPEKTLESIKPNILKQFKYLTLDADGVWVWKRRPRFSGGSWERPSAQLVDYRQIFQKNEWRIKDGKDMITRTSTLLAYIALKKIKDEPISPEEDDAIDLLKPEVQTTEEPDKVINPGTIGDLLSQYATKEQTARELQLKLLIKVLNDNPSIIPRVLKFVINKTNAMEQSDEC